MTPQEQRLAGVLEALLKVPLQEVKPGPAPKALLAGLDAVTPLTVLIVGRDLEPAVRGALQTGGCQLTSAASLTGALSVMEQQYFDVLVVDPHAGGDGHGLKFVRAIKQGVHERELSLEHLVLRYARVPFVIQPVPNDTQYAVFRSGGEWFLTDTLALSLADAVLRAGSLSYQTAGSD